MDPCEAALLVAAEQSFDRWSSHTQRAVLLLTKTTYMKLRPRVTIVQTANVQGLKFLSGLKQLKLKPIDGANINLTPLVELTRLSTLSLEGCGSGTPRLTALKSFVMPLANMTTLRTLRLEHVPVQPFMAAAACLKSLRDLFIKPSKGGDQTVLDIGLLSQLTGLQALAFQGMCVVSMSPISHMKFLKRLRLEDSGEIDEVDSAIVSLRIVSRLANLRELTLLRSLITDTGHLSALTALHTLELQHHTQSVHRWPLSLLVLSKLTSVTKLDIQKTHRTMDVEEVLMQLTSLRALNLGQASPPHLTALPACSLLQRLDMTQSILKDFDPISTLTCLKWLNLACQQMSTLLPLVPLRGLTGLNLFGNRQLLDFEPLSALTGLEQLMLGNTDVRDLAPLSALLGLQVLELSHTDISDLSPLSGLTRMRELHLSSRLGRGARSISDLSPLKPLTRLVVLKLAGHAAGTDLEPLTALSRTLERLSLTGTGVTDITPLSHLTALKQLTLCGTRVRDVAPLSSVSSLISLCLKDTCVVDVRPLSGLTRLKRLSLCDTFVTDPTPCSESRALRDLFLCGSAWAITAGAKGGQGLAPWQIAGELTSEGIALLDKRTKRWTELKGPLWKQCASCVWHSGKVCERCKQGEGDGAWERGGARGGAQQPDGFFKLPCACQGPSWLLCECGCDFRGACSACPPAPLSRWPLPLIGGSLC